MITLEVIVGKHVDVYLAYPIGIQGIVMGQGESF
jgi:hypothetical protein